MYFYHNHQNENRLKLSDKSGNLFPAIYLHQEFLKKKARQRQALFEELKKETRGTAFSSTAGYFQIRSICLRRHPWVDSLRTRCHTGNETESGEGTVRNIV
tara:strand:- start:1598 stop:1900 length:303 start_codon:yes stop_codon:yes gene_type:complete